MGTTVKKLDEITVETKQPFFGKSLSGAEAFSHNNNNSNNSNNNNNGDNDDDNDVDDDDDNDVDEDYNTNNDDDVDNTPMQKPLPLFSQWSFLEKSLQVEFSLKVIK